MPSRRPSAVTPTVTDPLEHATEAQWARVVEGLLDFYGWRWTHPPDNKPRANASGRSGRQRVGHRGYPDYTAVRNLPGQAPELAFLELKTNTGRLGPGQAEWIADLDSIGDALDEVAEPLEREFGTRREHLPRVIAGIYRPADKRRLEDQLAGPRGRNIPVAIDLGLEHAD